MAQTLVKLVLLATCIVSARARSFISLPSQPYCRPHPTAFVASPAASKTPAILQRPSTFVPALPNQFGHDRLSRWRSSVNSAITTSGSLRIGSSKVRGCRKSYTNLHAKQGIEEDVEVTVDLDGTITNQVQLPIDSNKNGDDVATTRATIIKKGAQDELLNSSRSASSTTFLVDDNKTQDIPEEFIPILALCFLVTLLSALDRVAMSIAILPISSEFGYSETIKGQISSAVSYGYGLAILPIGLAVSVVSPRKLMLVGVFLWSLATIGTPIMAQLSNSETLAAGDATTTYLLPLLGIRAVMGAAEAVVLPTMQRIIANWVPPEKKATVLAIVISGFQLGTVGAYLASPQILDFMSGLDGGATDIPGWRGMFYIYGLAGLLWMVPWSIVAKDAPTGKEAIDVDNCEEALVNNMIEDDASLVLNECAIESVGESPANIIDDMKALLQSAPWGDFVRSPGVWGMTLAHAAKNWELYNLLAWTPTFFSQQYGLNIKESALFSVLPSVCGMIGGLTAGNAADYILVKYVGDEKSNSKEALEKRTQIRKLFQSIALLGPAACLYLLSGLPEQATTAQLLLGGAVGMQAFDAAGFGAATQEKAGERWAGLLYSLTSLPGVMVGSISVSVTGQLLDMMADKEAGWTTVYQLNSAVCVVGALCFLFLYDSKKEFE